MVWYEGDAVGPYKIIRQVGQGGMATVYQAYHARLDRNVAIKVMHKAFTEEKDFLARFEREAQIVAKLEHPHIVPIYDYNDFEGQPYLVMKFVEGRTLKRVFSGGPLPLADITRIMNDVANALTYAHRRGVLHRDIKPSNILVADDGTVYLTDFGLARIAEMGSTTMSQDMILGTPQYISPEQASGHKNLDARTDVYSFGVILYEMVVGRVPFNADTPYAIVHDHIYTELPRPSEINTAITPAVEAVLVRALAKSPEARYASATELMEAFQEATQQSGLIALDPNRNRTAEKAFAQRRPHQMEDSPTLSTGLPPKSSIPSPVPNRQERDKKGSKRVVIERKLDTSQIPQQVDFGDLGKRVEDSIKKGAGWVERMASQIEVAAREGAKAAAAANAPPPEEELIRQRIEKRYQERQGLIIHSVAFVLVNIMLFGIFFAANGGDIAGEFPWPFIVFLGWGIGMFSHFFNYYYKYGAGAQRQEDAIQQEIERYKERSMAYEKPKNDQRMRLELTDDGEIMEVYDDDISSEKKSKRDR